MLESLGVGVTELGVCCSSSNTPAPSCLTSLPSSLEMLWGQARSPGKSKMRRQSPGLDEELPVSLHLT